VYHTQGIPPYYASLCVPGVYPYYASLCVPGVYLPIYTLLYTPGYTMLVYYPYYTPGVLRWVSRREALGSNLEIFRTMWRIEPSQLPKV